MKPDIITAVRDGNLFRPYVTGHTDGGLTSWRQWLTFLKALYGLKTHKLDHDLIRQCTGRDPAKLCKKGYQECLLLCGRRSGKSKTIALVAAAEAVLSGKEAGLSKGEIPMVAILSPTRFQSRIIFEYLKGVFESSPLLANEVVSEHREGFKLKNGVEVAIITGDPRSCRGFSVIAAVVDEIAMFGLTEESKVRSDMELVRAIRPSLASTGGRLLCVGTPYAAKGYAYLTFKRAYGNDDCDVLCWNAPSLLMNPTLNESIVQRAIDDDPIAARVEYCVTVGLFREDVETFIDRATVENLVIRGRRELSPQGVIRYSAFADMSGGRHDDAALAIGHIDGSIVILDLLERWKAPHNPIQVAAEMAALLKRYGCDRLLGDAYSAEWCRQTFATFGINYERANTTLWNDRTAILNKVAKPKGQLYIELLPRLNSGAVELLDNEILVNQLCSLERRTRSGMRDSIDHPPGGHDDVANVLAGVVDACFHRRAVAGPVDSIARLATSPLEKALANLEHAQRHEEWLAKKGQDHNQEFKDLMRRTGRVSGGLPY